jgi:hypothetical protein
MATVYSESGGGKGFAVIGVCFVHLYQRDKH